MKLGIYTFIAANNYGAILQAYALKEFLRKNGCDAHCVDYRPAYLWDKYQPFSKLRLRSGSVIKNFIRDIIFFRWLKKKNKAYEIFRKEFLSLIPEKNVPEMETIIVGSDQIWNFKLTHGDEKFLGIISGFQGKVVSYAASAEELNGIECGSLSAALKHMSNISVREKSLQTFLLRNFNMESTLVLDPTFLLERSEWECLEDVFSYRKPYILAYIFGISKKERDELTILAAEKGLDLFIFCGEAKPGKGILDFESPCRFLSVIHNASFVVTNSFHGTAFSIIYGKKFCVIRKSSNERIETLLGLVGGQKAFLQLNKKIEYSDFVEISDCTDELKKMKDQSKNYLKNVFNGNL